MRETIIIVIVLVLIFSVAYVSKKYLDETADELIGELEVLKEELDISIKTQDTKIAEEKAKQIKEKWEDINNKWTLMIIHDELDLIELSLTGITASLEVNELGDTRQELDKAIFLLGHIKDKEAFKLKNVF